MKKTFLLDTCTCVFLLRGKYNIGQYLDSIGWSKCCISEITETELLYGAFCSGRNMQKELESLKRLFSRIEIIPFNVGKRQYAEEKAKLRFSGLIVDDFDLLIGSTAKVLNLTLITDNIKHFSRIEGLNVENWVKR